MAHLFFPWFALSTSFFITVNTHAETAFSMHSTSFADRRDIPAKYTCDGGELSPQMSWSGAPAKTQAFVLICQDPDAPSGTWYHWVVYNLPPTVNSLPEGAALPAGAALGKNSWGKARYNGPCPPPSTIHRYVFTLYALDSRLDLPPGVEAMVVEKALQGHVLGKTTLLGVFGR